MVLDTSAVMAILFDEPEAEAFVREIEAASVRLISVMNWVEASFVVLGRKGEPGFNDLERFITEAMIERVQVDQAQGALAIIAFRRFGKGRHPAALNLCDCFAYALAKATGEPLLFKGQDFALTDIAAASPQRPQAKACLNAAQIWRWAAIASSTTGTMPKKPWIMPGYSRYSTGTPARRKASA